MDVLGNLRFINLGNGELQNAILERLSADPSGVAGRLYYNTTDNVYKFFNGTVWLEVGTGGGISSLQDEVDLLQETLGDFVNTDGSFNAGPLNLLDNVSGLTGGGSPDSLLDALSQLDAAITVAQQTADAAAATFRELDDVALGSPAVNDFIVYVAGSPETLKNLGGQDARDAMGAVNIAGDTMTGDLEFSSGSQLLADHGTVTEPGIAFFGSPEQQDTGLYWGTTTSLGEEVNFIGVSVDGVQVARFERSVTGSPTTGRLFVVDEVTVTDGAIITDQNSTASAPGYTFLGDEDTGMFHDTADEVAFTVGGAESLRLLSDGTLSVSAVTDYETLLTDDDDIPNKKYVDDEIAAATPDIDLDYLTDVSITSPAVDQFLIYTTTGGSPALLVQNRTPAQARTSLGLDAGGAGDIWVEKAGDTMTGNLVMSGADVVLQSGSAAAPSLTFDGDDDTGLSAATADTLVLSAGGNPIVTVGTGDVTLAHELLNVDGTAANPAVSFTNDPDSGLYSSAPNEVSVAVGGTQSLVIRDDGRVGLAQATVGSPLAVADNDLTTKAYVDAQIGGTVSQLDDLSDVQIGGSPGVAPTVDQFLVYTGASLVQNRTPAQARTALGLDAGGAGDIWVEKAGDTMTGNLDMGGNLISNLGAPVVSGDAANKEYVDQVAAGIKARQAVAVHQDSDLSTLYAGSPTVWIFASGSPEGVGTTLTAPQNGALPSIDGVASTLDERVLVSGQTNAEENGVYVVTSLGDGSNPAVLTRDEFVDDNDELPSSFVFVQEGTVYADTGWVASVTDAATFQIDQDPNTWIQFTGSGSINGGVGLTLTGTTLDVNLGAGIVESPTDEIGIDLWDEVTGALILTEDGTTRSGGGSPASAIGANSRLHLLLNGTSLEQGVNGLTVADTTVAGDTGTFTFVPSDTVTFAGTSAQGIETSASGSTLTVSALDASDTQKGVASFDAGDFTVTSGNVELNPSAISATVAQPVLLNGGSPAAFIMDGSSVFNLVAAESVFGVTAGSPTSQLVGSPGAVVTPNRDFTLTTNGVDTVTIALNAFLGDLQDVGGGVNGVLNQATDQWFGGSASGNLVSFRQLYNTYQYGSPNFTANFSAYYQDDSAPATYLDRGQTAFVWDGYSWTAGPLINTSSIATDAYDWRTRHHLRRRNLETGTVTTVVDAGLDHSDPDSTSNDDVFARYDNANQQWRNFTLVDLVSAINNGGATTEITNLGGTALDQDVFTTFNADTGTTTANTTTDTLTVAGGTAISTEIVGDTLTITNTSPNVNQNLFETIGADTGEVTANSVADRLNLLGGTGISTTASASVGSPASEGVTIAIDASVNQLNDVVITSAQPGEVLAYAPTGSPASAGNVVNTKVYAESGLRSASTNHTYAHNLGQRWVNVTVVDNTNQVIIPDTIEMVNDNEVSVTFGTSIQCRIIVMGVPTAP